MIDCARLFIILEFTANHKSEYQMNPPEENQNLNSDLLIKPNPVSERFDVSAPAGATIAVRDIFGKLLYAGAGGKISTSGRSAGVYFVEAASGGKRSVAKSVVFRQHIAQKNRKNYDTFSNNLVLL